MNRRNTSRFRQILIAAVALSAGCGVDRFDAEAKVKNIAEQTMKSPVSAVRCPEAERKAGVTFECDVTFVEGGTHRLLVSQTDDHGNFVPRWKAQILSMTQLAASLVEVTRVESGRTITASCGTGVREITQAGFECTVDGAPVVVEVDARDASWRIRAPAAPARP